MKPRKVNWKNVSIVLITTVVGLVIGFIDRIVNNVGVIGAISEMFSKMHAIEPSAEWYNTTSEIAMSSTSGFNLLGIIIIVIIGVAIMSMVVGACRCAA